METYSQLYSTVLHNNKTILCDLTTWANITLSGNSLSQFKQDEIEFANFFREITTNEFIYSSVTDSLGNQIKIGDRYTFADVKDSHVKYDHWQNEFANDPKVIIYRPLVKE
jgi:hypothetical protein